MGVATTEGARTVNAAVRRAAMASLVLSYPSCLANTHCGGLWRILRHDGMDQTLALVGLRASVSACAGSHNGHTLGDIRTFVTPLVCAAPADDPEGHSDALDGMRAGPHTGACITTEIIVPVGTPGFMDSWVAGPTARRGYRSDRTCRKPGPTGRGASRMCPGTSTRAEQHLSSRSTTRRARSAAPLSDP
jgi:hypothetical protein